MSSARGYVNYAKLFGDAEFIWTRNIRLDNLVLARYTARGPRRSPTVRRSVASWES